MKDPKGNLTEILAAQVIGNSLIWESIFKWRDAQAEESWRETSSEARQVEEAIEKAMIKYTHKYIKMNQQSATKEPKQEEKSAPLPFNLEAAKRGEDIVTRGGLKVKFIGYEPSFSESARLVCAVEGEKRFSTYYENGRFHNSAASSHDLFMAPKPEEVKSAHLIIENVCSKCNEGRSEDLPLNLTFPITFQCARCGNKDKVTKLSGLDTIQAYLNRR